jgi:hypothetical protein
MYGEYEHTFMCPYCGSQIEMILEQFYPEQEYIEDCPVCCNPIKISYRFQGETLTYFKAESIEQ